MNITASIMQAISRHVFAGSHCTKCNVLKQLIVAVIPKLAPTRWWVMDAEVIQLSSGGSSDNDSERGPNAPKSSTLLPAFPDKAPVCSDQFTHEVVEISSSEEEEMGKDVALTRAVKKEPEEDPEAAVNRLLDLCKAEMSKEEFSKIELKIAKKTKSISNCPEKMKCLAEFIDGKLGGRNGDEDFSVWICTRSVLDEINRLSSNSKVVVPSIVANKRKIESESNGIEGVRNKVPKLEGRKIIRPIPVPSELDVRNEGKREHCVPTEDDDDEGDEDDDDDIDDEEQQQQEAALLDAKTKKRVQKLESALSKCTAMIRKLEEREMGLDDLDEEDSAYMKLSRYRKKAVDIDRAIERLKKADKNVVPNMGRRTEKKLHLGDLASFPEINTKVEKFVNLRIRNNDWNNMVPDFQDILDLLQKINAESRLLSQNEIRSEAVKIFKCVAEKLKKRRKRDEHDDLVGYFPPEFNVSRADPANADKSMAEKLRKSAKRGETALSDVMDDFAARTTHESQDDDDDQKDELDETGDEEEEGETGETLPSLDQ